MSHKVLIYSRFPKAMMVRIGQRFELMDAAGKPPHEMFTAEQLAGITAMITAGGTPLGGDMMDRMPKLGAIVGKNVRVGVGALLMPGVRVEKNAVILPGTTAFKDVTVNQT